MPHENYVMQEKPFNVTEITRLIKGTLESHPVMSGIWIRGEIYNLTYHSSGHIYFTLKDEGASIQAAFFKNANKNLSFQLKEGMMVLVSGKITVFEKRGNYQVTVFQARPDGIGELQQRIEELKKLLMSEGIFNEDRRRPLPFLPRTIGVVTSPTGAALRDIMKVALRRYPNIHILLAPAKVQGDDAALTIVRGIEELNDPRWKVDVIIAGRGGGSFEDLLPFSEEPVVRAFAESRVPIISAVGHQIDTPLSDFAADRSAPTPSAAAEIAVPVKQELHDEINYMTLRSQRAVQAKLQQLQMRIDAASGRHVFESPRETLKIRAMQLISVTQRINGSIQSNIAHWRRTFSEVPSPAVPMRSNMARQSLRFSRALERLEALSPLAVLKRGYSYVTDSEKRIVRSVSALTRGDEVTLRFHDGYAAASIEKIKVEKGAGN